MLQGKVLVAQGGGPTAVINQSLVGAVIESRKIPSVERVYGAYHGVSGVINEDFLDLTQETTHNLEMVAETSSSGLGSTRDKPDEKYCAEMLKVLKAHDIETFFYIGGNDSSDTLRILDEQARASNFPLTCVHIPKTIDNDLMVNDHTPGFPSAARFVALAFSGSNLDNRSLPGVYIAVVMGRHAGFLTAASALGRKFDDDGPHLIYIPERTLNLDAFATSVQNVYNKYGRCIVAVSEGVHDESGQPIVAKLAKEVERDAHGNVQLSGTSILGDLLADHVKATTKISRVRADTLGYQQRSFLGVVSDVDAREAREVGERAVKYAHFGDSKGNHTGSVTIHRTGSYSVDYQLTALTEIAAKTRVMPDEFITPDGTNVTDQFKLYLRPLLGSGMPEISRLRVNKVPKVLNK
ncbi:MAG: 6-phosphofructokinase [Hyphomicrobiales bacterium]|nr:6-phosphofructokinase [Hyphomicrobiales bacterium]